MGQSLGGTIVWSSRKDAHTADEIYGLLYRLTVRPPAEFLDTYGGMLAALFTNINVPIEVSSTCKLTELQDE